jgi:hypothetical protein
MNWTIKTLLWIHIYIVGIFLALVALILWRRGLLRWDRAGFWAWAAFGLYYILNPFFALRNNALLLYEINLSLAGGITRGQRILLVLLLGMTAFFWAYLRTNPGQTNWRLQSSYISPLMLTALLPIITFGAYSLLTQRSFILESGRQAVVEGGRFLGQISGYESAGYMFLMVPMMILLLSRERWRQAVGWIAAGLFIILAMPKGWSRFALVSVTIALSLVSALQRKAAWPNWYFLPAIFVFALAMQLRGHANWTLESAASEMIAVSSEAVQDIGRVTANAVGSTEVSALATWYLESHFTEQYAGYSYGLPIINYVLTGWIPSRIFPQKYFLVDWLASQRTYAGRSVESQLFGAKSTLFGSFYNEGGLAGVIILGALAGFLSRKLDGLMHRDAPLLVRATGVSWMSVLWMVWQSSTTWSVMLLGVLGLPAFAMWIFAPKVLRPKQKNSPPNSLIITKTQNIENDKEGLSPL